MSVQTSDITTSTETLGPVGDISANLPTWVWDTLAANVPADLHLPVLLSTLLIATGIFLLRGGHGSKGADGRERPASLLTFLLPADIYSHTSARVDLWLWIFERLLHPFWAVALFTTVGVACEQAVIGTLQSIAGNGPALQSNLAWMLLYSLLTLLCYDFIFYVIHYTMHKVPWLWALHKVHHSAEVLTPLTRSREHILAGPIWATGSAVSYGVVGGLFGYLFEHSISQATLLNIGVFSLLFGFNGSFRHYHVQFHYPRWLSLWLHSPVMHHTHHSYLEHHWNSNMAAVTSIWDRMFGTLYIPAKDEYTPWGLGPETQHQYRSFWQNTSGPFRDWWQLLRGDSAPSQPPNDTELDR